MRRGNNRGVREKESSIHWDQLVCGIKFMLESSMLIKKGPTGAFLFLGVSQIWVGRVGSAWASVTMFIMESHMDPSVHLGPRGWH